MAYSVNLILTASDADTLIQMAQRDKRNMEHRQESLEIRSENSSEDSVERSAELTAAQSALAAATSLIATLPDGEMKEDQVTKKMELELKIRKLTKSGNKLGTIALLELEYDTDLLDRQVDGIDAFIAAVTARKAQL